jgi:hypothetical protein
MSKGIGHSEGSAIRSASNSGVDKAERFRIVLRVWPFLVHRDFGRHDSTNAWVVFGRLV